MFSSSHNHGHPKDLKNYLLVHRTDAIRSWFGEFPLNWKSLARLEIIEIDLPTTTTMTTRNPIGSSSTWNQQSSLGSPSIVPLSESTENCRLELSKKCLWRMMKRVAMLGRKEVWNKTKNNGRWQRRNQKEFGRTSSIGKSHNRSERPLGFVRSPKLRMVRNSKVNPKRFLWMLRNLHHHQAFKKHDRTSRSSLPNRVKLLVPIPQLLSRKATPYRNEMLVQQQISW